MLQSIASAWTTFITHLTAAGHGSLIETHAQIMATIVTLLLTLVLIPVQQGSSQYSSALLRYFRVDQRLLGFLLLLFALVFLVVVFMLTEPKRWMDYVASAAVIVSLGVLVLVIDRVMTMLDVNKFLLPQLSAQTEANLDAAFRATGDETDQSADEWQQAFEEGSEVGEFAKPGEKKYRVRADLRALEDDVRVWKTLGIRLTGSGDYQAFEGLITRLGDITRRYLHKRSEYRSANDPFLWFLSETFDHLARSAESQPNETFSVVLSNTLSDCAITAVKTNSHVLGAGKGYHKLAEPFVRLLRQHAVSAREAGRRRRAYETLARYSDVALTLAERKYGLSAIEIAKETLEFALQGVDKGDTYFFRLATRRVSRIILLTALYSRVYDEHQSPNDTIAALISVMLKEAIKTGDPEALTEPLTGYSAPTHISRICLVALFASKDAAVAEANIAIVDRIVDVIAAIHIGSGNIEWNLTEHLHSIGICLLAAAHREVFAALAVEDASSAILDVAPERVIACFLKCVRHMVAAYASAQNGPTILELVQNRELERTLIHHEGLLLRRLLSLLYLGLHFDRQTARGLRAPLEAAVTTLAANTAAAKQSAPADQAESLDVFAAFVRRLGADALATGLESAVQAKRLPPAPTDGKAVRELEEPLINLKLGALEAWNKAIFEVTV